MKSKYILPFALLMGVLSAGMVYSYVSGLQTDLPTQQMKMVSVVVATQDISEKSLIDKGMITLKEIPLNSVHPDAMLLVNDVEGRLVKEKIIRGEQVLRSRLFSAGENMGFSYTIPPGKRAITVGVNEVIGVAGFIKPGDYVDVISTIETPETGSITSTVLQGVEVLAIAQTTSDEGYEAKVTTTVTLALNVKEAELLTYAEEKGSLRLALRSAYEGVGYSSTPGEGSFLTSSTVKTSTDVITTWTVDVIRGESRQNIEVR